MADTIRLKTNLRCEACVAKVKPALEAALITNNLSFDMKSPDKIVSFTGNSDQAEKAISILKDHGYAADVLQANTPPLPSASIFATYKPLFLIGVFLVLVTALAEAKSGAFAPHRAMNNFMGGFLIFPFFKFLNLSGFADAFSTYDLLAKKSRAYALAYPFIEAALGVSFILEVVPFATNLLTAALMVLGNIGVWTVLRKKQTVQCACLGTVLNLPMTKVTLFENTLMLAMALISIAVAL